MNLRIKFFTIQAWNTQNITDCLESISRKKNLMNGILKLDKIDLTVCWSLMINFGGLFASTNLPLETCLHRKLQKMGSLHGRMTLYYWENVSLPGQTKPNRTDKSSLSFYLDVQIQHWKQQNDIWNLSTEQ